MFLNSLIIYVIISALAITGVYLFIINILTWKKSTPGLLRAKVFLSKSFLKTHFILTVCLGVFAIIHVLIEPLELTGLIQKGILWDLVFEGGHIVIMLNLVLMSYMWYIILHRKNSE